MKKSLTFRLWKNSQVDPYFLCSRLAPFDIKEVREITMYDELDLDMLGDERTALFLIMSDTDGPLHF